MLAVLGIAAVWIFRRQPADNPVVPVVPALPVESEAKVFSGRSAGSESLFLAHTDPVEDFVLLPKASQSSGLYDYLFSLVDPESLKRFQGSYSMEDLSSGTPSYSLSSQWFLDRPFLPRVRVSVRKNEESGDYELGGLQVQLPNSPLNVSYEHDADSDEQKALLQLRFSF